MPYEIQHPTPRCWQVVNTDTGKVHSKCTTKTKAQAQMRLLYGVESGKWKPTPGGSYRSFVAAEFKKRPAGVSAPEWMKQIGAKWRKRSSGGGMEEDDVDDERERERAERAGAV